MNRGTALLFGCFLAVARRDDESALQTLSQQKELRVEEEDASDCNGKPASLNQMRQSTNSAGAYASPSMGSSSSRDMEEENPNPCPDECLNPLGDAVMLTMCDSFQCAQCPAELMQANCMSAWKCEYAKMYHGDCVPGALCPVNATVEDFASCAKICDDLAESGCQFIVYTGDKQCSPLTKRGRMTKTNDVAMQSCKRIERPPPPGQILHDYVVAVTAKHKKDLSDMKMAAEGREADSETLQALSNAKASEAKEAAKELKKNITSSRKNHTKKNKADLLAFKKIAFLRKIQADNETEVLKKWQQSITRDHMKDYKNESMHAKEKVKRMIAEQREWNYNLVPIDAIIQNWTMWDRFNELPRHKDRIHARIARNAGLGKSNYSLIKALSKYVMDKAVEDIYKVPKIVNGTAVYAPLKMF